MEHKHCKRIAAAILDCADEHSVALLLDNEKEEAHRTPEWCSPAEYHNIKADVGGADCFRLFKLHQGTIVDDNHGSVMYMCQRESEPLAVHSEQPVVYIMEWKIVGEPWIGFDVFCNRLEPPRTARGILANSSGFHSNNRMQTKPKCRPESSR